MILGVRSFFLDVDGKFIKGILCYLILEDNVIVYFNVIILGWIIIGCDVIVGGNIWVIENILVGVRIV